MKITENAEIVRSGFHIAAKTHREPERPPQHGRPTHGHKALDHYRQHILAADETAVKKSQPRRHQHDEAGAKQHKSGIACVDVWHKGFSCSRVSCLKLSYLVRLGNVSLSGLVSKKGSPGASVKSASFL